MGWHQYAAAWAEQHGGYDLRRAPASVRAWVRAAYAVARGLVSLRVTPGVMFGFGLLLAAAVPLAAGSGPAGLLAAAGLVLLLTFASALDGALTVLTLGAPARAVIRTVVAGRLGEVAWLAGFWVAGVPVALLIGCGAVTAVYDLARREALAAGMTQLGVQTVADPPMRVSAAAIGFTMAGFVGLAGVPLAAGLLSLAAMVWLVLAVIGAGQLAGVVRRSLP